MPDDTKTIWKTNVGSHMWGMNRPDSDIDIFEAYSVPTCELLRGLTRANSHNSKIGSDDIVRHEVGKIIPMLIAGNINFVLGVMSPIILQDSPDLQELRRIYTQNLSKNIYHSISGMAVHNYHKYFETEKDCSWKKLAQVLRLLNFGITLLSDKRIEFKAIPLGEVFYTDMISRKIKELEQAYNLSDLPATPDEEPYRDWLYNLRISILGGSLHE